MKDKKQENEAPKGQVEKDQPDQSVDVNYTLDSNSIEAAKKLKRKTFEKLLSKDLEIIEKHNKENN
ncbi:hypothetical protein [Pseudomonas syringae group genomosp. 7]|uniref:hypothetical protein n=1 Tax=Pseudomonas syringae group genomosp. 7 TaxID=251699 RepID=UPI0006D5F43B|nr:hypothetical protein [Pseudomonas syringae group genomosp. 7]UNB64675.1 hypothetical protein MME54_07845 [Pseudomonas syringae pv. helianthi]